jgi:hypothetical protein
MKKIQILEVCVKDQDKSRFKTSFAAVVILSASVLLLDFVAMSVYILDCFKATVGRFIGGFMVSLILVFVLQSTIGLMEILEILNPDQVHYMVS